MEFETLFKVIIAGIAAFGIPIGAYAAFAATRAIWIRGEPGRITPELQGQVDALAARIAELEAERERLAELEERVDFAERLLAREKAQPRLGE